mmetsp:Transcript_31546/g.86923  ORF Transcript_31546/g.86923 Transcript_31546/m.86923 type:complete len:247 (+) Transcript_31546:1252-1992(+)
MLRRDLADLVDVLEKPPGAAVLAPMVLPNAVDDEEKAVDPFRQASLVVALLFGIPEGDSVPTQHRHDLLETRAVHRLLRGHEVHLVRARVSEIVGRLAEHRCPRLGLPTCDGHVCHEAFLLRLPWQHVEADVIKASVHGHQHRQTLLAGAEAFELELEVLGILLLVGLYRATGVVEPRASEQPLLRLVPIYGPQRPCHEVDVIASTFHRHRLWAAFAQRKRGLHTVVVRLFQRPPLRWTGNRPNAA